MDGLSQPSQATNPGAGWLFENHVLWNMFQDLTPQTVSQCRKSESKGSESERSSEIALWWLSLGLQCIFLIIFLRSWSCDAIESRNLPSNKKRAERCGNGVSRLVCSYSGILSPTFDGARRLEKARATSTVESTNPQLVSGNMCHNLRGNYYGKVPAVIPTSETNIFLAQYGI